MFSNKTFFPLWVYGGRSGKGGKNGFTESLSSGTNNFWITNIHKSKKTTPTPNTQTHTMSNTHHQPQNKKENSQSKNRT